MYRNLFIAWYCLGVLALFLVSALISTPLIGWDGVRGSTGFLGFLGLLPLITMPQCRTCLRVFREEKLDERDHAFLQKALFGGFCAAFGIIFGVSGLIDFIVRHWMMSDSISMEIFWLPKVCGVIVGTFAFSTTMLCLYYKGDMPLWEGAND